MKQRFGERRAAPRFDIVGLLKGTVESRQHHKVRNISPGGALLDAGRIFEIGMRVTGRLSDGRVLGPARGDVRWVAPHAAAPHSARYFVGVAWIDPPSGLDVASSEPATTPDALPGGVERRATPRRACAPDSTFDMTVSASVTVVDVSACGVFFSSSAPLETGTQGRLAMHLGGEDFAGDLEVRRAVKRQGSRPDWGVGAAFLPLSDGSRHSLATLLQRKM